MSAAAPRPGAPGTDAAPADAAPAAAPAPVEAAPLPLAALVLAVTAYLVHGVVTMDVPPTATFPGPAFFPTVVAVVSGVVGTALVLQHAVQARGRRTRSAPEAAPAAPAVLRAASTGAEAAAGGAPVADDRRIAWRPVLLVAGSFLVFVLVLEPVGWLVSAALLFYGVLVGLGSRRPLVDAGIALVFSAVVQLVFSAGLGLALPAGVLGGV